MKQQAIIQSTFILSDHNFLHKRFLQEHHNMQQQKNIYYTKFFSSLYLGQQQTNSNLEFPSILPSLFQFTPHLFSVYADSRTFTLPRNFHYFSKKTWKKYFNYLCTTVERKRLVVVVFFKCTSHKTMIVMGLVTAGY